MHYLIDTNVFLWFVEGDPRLDSRLVDRITEPSSELWISVASLWEITIKISKGRLLPNIDLKDYFRRRIDDNEIRILPIKTDHLLMLETLPFHHKDPFDRLIASQSLSENLPLLYTDVIFDRYFT